MRVAASTSPGVDGVTFAMIDVAGPEAWLAGIRKDLIEQTYRPEPVRRMMIQSLARHVVERNVLRLIKMWLKAPVEERDGEGKRRMSGGQHSTCGTPQGGVVSPMLANLYMNRFLKYWRPAIRRRGRKCGTG